MHKDILNENDRKVLCDYLAENAPDELLLRAVEDTREHRKFVQDEFEGVRKYIGAGKFFPSTGQVKTTVQPYLTQSSEDDTKKQLSLVESVNQKSSNTEPPGTPVKRIGSGTLAQITRKLQEGPATLAAINQFINGNQSNTQSILRLMWDRKQVRYNKRGEYLLP